MPKDNKKYPFEYYDFCQNHGDTLFKEYRTKRTLEKSSWTWRYSTRCIECEREKRNNKRRTRKIEILKQSGSKCSKCGYNKIPQALHFHHLEEKEFGVSRKIDKDYSLLLKEVEKCIVLCSNCHQKEHSKWTNNLDDLKSLWHWRKFNLYKAFGSKCFLCKNSDIACLQFHHLKNFEKEYTLSLRTTLEKNPEKIWKEAVKCVLLCANCHSEVEQGFYKNYHQSFFLKNYPFNLINFEKWNNLIDRTKRKKLSSKDNSKISIKKNRESYCIDCQSKITSEAKRCVPCSRINSRSIEWPSRQKLLELLTEMNPYKLGKYLGVSDNAIRKHLKSQYGIYL